MVTSHLLRPLWSAEWQLGPQCAAGGVLQLLPAVSPERRPCS